MNIQNWGLGQIMQLPDHLFGRRFMVSCTLDIGTAARVYDISEVALPEMCVVWELYVTGLESYGTNALVRIALGDQLPTVEPMFAALDPLFMGLGLQGAEPRSFLLHEYASISMRRLRMPVASQGKRLVIEGETGDGVRASVFVGIVVSGVPKEIPEWYRSV